MVPRNNIYYISYLGRDLDFTTREWSSRLTGRQSRGWEYLHAARAREANDILNSGAQNFVWNSLQNNIMSCKIWYFVPGAGKKFWVFVMHSAGVILRSEGPNKKFYKKKYIYINWKEIFNNVKFLIFNVNFRNFKL